MSIEELNPADCRMWHLHHRLGESVDAGSCAELIKSLANHGQKQPVLGRRVMTPDGPSVELVYGARRLFAAQQLAMPLVVDIRKVDDRSALIEMDIENRQRVDISPYERGLSYRQWLRSNHFANQAEMAKALGISEAQISRLLKYAELPAAVIGAFPCASEIREEWAVTLAKRCREPQTREMVIRRARERTSSSQKRTPQDIYDALVADRSQRRVESKSHDEVVKGTSGKPLLRVGYRAKTVHLVIPRDRLTPALLRDITEQIRVLLDQENALQQAASAQRERKVRSGHNGVVVPLNGFSIASSFAP